MILKRSLYPENTFEVVVEPFGTGKVFQLY